MEVVPAKNADILTLLLKKQVDGAWVPEPWGERFIKELIQDCSLMRETCGQMVSS